MKVLVFGGRNYSDRRRLYAVLDAAHERSPISVIIEGEMSGADRLAREWAESRGVDVDPYPADWDNIERPGAVVKRNRRGKLYDAAAGPFRNERMLREKVARIFASPHPCLGVSNMSPVSERELKALRALGEVFDHDANCLSFKGIAQRFELELKHVRRTVRALARKGFALYIKGL